MTEESIKKIIAYWKTTAAHDYATMESLFKTARYSDCLFFGHLVIEKILKALIVQKTHKHPKFTHNLLVILQDTEIKLGKEEKEFLAELNRFNIRTRYPDFQLSFYKLCTKDYVKPRLDKIKKLYKMLWQKLKL